MYFLLICLLTSCSYFSFEQKYKMEDVFKEFTKDQAANHISRIDNTNEYEHFLSLGIIGPDYKGKEGHTLLMFAKTREIARMLITKGAVKEAKTKKGENILMLAAKNGNRDVCEYFLDELKIDPNIGDKDRNVPIMLTGNVEILKLLQSRGADINKKNIVGWNVIFHASFRGYEAACRYFIKEGISPKYKTKDGSNALTLAKTREVAKLLVENGADKDVISTSGLNILMLAAVMGNKDVCEYLIDELGMNPNYRGSDGCTALMVAKTEEIKKMLRKRGAIPTPPKQDKVKNMANNISIISSDMEKFIKKIEENINFDLSKDDFIEKVQILKNEIEDTICFTTLYNWIFFNCLQKKSAYRLEIIELFIDNIKKFSLCEQTGYNFLHAAVYFKDSEMFIKYFDEKDLYSTGSIYKAPKVNPMQALFLLNLSDESAILKFLKEIDSCLTKENIEKSGALYMGCRLGMVDVVKYLIGKGADIRVKNRVEIPGIKTGAHKKEELLKIKEYNLEFSALCLALNLCEYHNLEAHDPLKILLTKVIFVRKKGEFILMHSCGREKESKSLNILINSVPHVFHKIVEDLEKIVKDIFSDIKKIFPKKSDEEVATIERNFLNELNFDKEEALKEQINTERFINIIRLLNLNEIYNRMSYNDSKKLLSPFLNINNEGIPLSLLHDILLDFIKNYKYAKKMSIEENERAATKNIDMYCDCLDHTSGIDYSNLEFMKNKFEIEKKGILGLIKEKYFGVARILVRFPEQFGINKNKIFVNKGKKKSGKRTNGKKTWFDKIVALKKEKDIDEEELEETISLARDKGWMTAEEVSEIQIFENEKKKREKDRKKGKEFKELQEYSEDQKRQKLEQEKKRKELEDKQKEEVKRVKESRTEEKASFDYVEEIINYFELDEEETNKKFEELVMSENKEELVVLMNKAGEKIDRSFEVVKVQDEKVRQLLIIREFVVNKELALSILEKNQKKVMTTLLREITKDVREEIFNFSKEERKIEITEEMKEIMGKYGEGFKVIKEEEKPKKQKIKAKNIEYEIYTIEGMDEGSKSYLYEEFKERSLLALQNMKGGRGDVKKISSKEELFEYRMLGHGEESNLRIYYKQEGKRKIILEVSYKGTDELSVRKVESLERKSKNVKKINEIELN